MEPLKKDSNEGLTKLAKLTASLIEVDNELDNLFSTSQNFLCLIHEDDRFVRVGTTWTTALGWTADDLCSQSFFNFIHPDDIDKTREAWEGRTKQGEPVRNFVNRYRCMDGSYRTLLWNTPGMTSKGTLFSSATDITGLVIYG